MTPIRTARLILRDWREDDRALFHLINADEQVMEYFPFRHDRAASDALMDEISADISACGYGFAAVEIAGTGECAGFCGIQQVELEPFLPAGAIEIGWRLAPRFWGRGIATEAARAWLSHGFGTLGFEEIVSFAAAVNLRSLAVMERIGMMRDAGGGFDHPAIPDTHPHLRRFLLHRLGHDQWRQREGAAEAAP